jgi:hypothetical protein
VLALRAEAINPPAAAPPTPPMIDFWFSFQVVPAQAGNMQAIIIIRIDILLSGYVIFLTSYIDNV